MKLCYQVATPDVDIAPSVTAFQGSLEHTFSRLSEIGYDGVELMTRNPNELDWDEVKSTAEKYNLAIPLVCTGEIYGQLKLSFADPDEEVRHQAVERVKEIIDFASFLGGNINIGRVRGQYQDGIDEATTYEWAVQAFRQISQYGSKKNVDIALESVFIMETNFLNTIEQAAQMVDDVQQDNFKIMMDLFHMNIEQKDLLQTIKDYSDYNMHVHLADNNRRYPGHCGLDFKEIIKTFHDVGYDGAFCTEIFQIPDQESAAIGAMEHLAPIFNEIYARPIK